jgi:glycosyltransferase involved in cell wall biosynthesis
MEHVCVIVPAYNEAHTIGTLVKKIKNKGFAVVVIDDGSTDSTHNDATASGAFVIRHSENQGKGISIKQGIQHVLAKHYDAAVIMDGDGQHDPEEIPDFLKHAEKTGHTFITGNRMANPTSMPALRVITNRLMSMIVSAFCRQRIPDTQCGYRFIGADVLKKLSLTSEKYDIESEILIEAARMDITIDSIPIRSIYRKERSDIKPFVDTLRFLRLLIIKTLSR